MTRHSRWLPPIPWGYIYTFVAALFLSAILLEATVGMNVIGCFAIAFHVAFLGEWLHVVIRRRLRSYFQEGARG